MSQNDNRRSFRIDQVQHHDGRRAAVRNADGRLGT